MAILVAGGAGYIGSHNVRLLQEAGKEPIIVDNLFTGHRESLPADAPFHNVDIRDEAALSEIFASNSIDAVLHFAASSLVSDSMAAPVDYFHNNIGGMITLLKVMAEHGVKKIVFSSSAAVYGQPEATPIGEDAPLKPTNPYGESKAAMERMMRWCSQAYGMRFVSLRYFNVGGAWPGGELGEDHRPESHLIPLMLQTPLGRKDFITVFGKDYPTKDGSCIRDYLEIMDLADAHMRALAYLEAGEESLVCNLGSGAGYSVLEMIEAARNVTGHPMPVKFSGRRPGDPAILVASSGKAKEALGWEAAAGIEDIIKSAWEWHKNHPNGFVLTKNGDQTGSVSV